MDGNESNGIESDPNITESGQIQWLFLVPVKGGR